VDRTLGDHSAASNLVRSATAAVKTGLGVERHHWILIFIPPNQIIEALGAAHLTVSERIEREPYEGFEYPSRRCYLIAKAH
jgi:hypothetical protein